MPRNWNKGFNKYTHPSVLKISETMKRKNIDNFKRWREKMRMSGKIKSEYPDFRRGVELAELVGVILGDGHIQVFPRTERLLIVGNSANKGFIKRYAKFIGVVVKKVPTVVKVKTSNSFRISIYEKNLSKRFGIPAGSRKNLRFIVPRWIKKNKRMLHAFLRGLYEAEGSFCVHKPTYTYKMLFSNKNRSLLNNVYNSVKSLGFHPHRSKYQIQISRQKEVYDFKKMINFRKYD